MEAKMKRRILPSTLLVLCSLWGELSAGEQIFEGCRRKYLRKQGGVRDMRANEIGDAAVAYLFVMRLRDGRA